MKTWQQVAAFGLTLALGAAAHAQTRTWVGPAADGSGDGLWNVAAHWSDSDIPNTSAEIADTNTTHNNVITLDLPNGNTIHSLLIHLGDTVNFITTGGARTINIANDIVNDGTLSLVNAGSGAKNLTKNAGTGTLTNTGLINLELGVDHTGGGANLTLTGRSVSDISLPAIVHTNTGTININQNTPGSTLSIALLITGQDSVFRNEGTLNIGNGSSTMYRGTTAIFEQAAGTTTVGTSVDSLGSVRGQFINISGGVLKGTGILSAGALATPATVTVSGTGTIAPGTSIGTLTVGTAALPVDDFNFTGGTYEWELGALSTANPGVDFDQIVQATGNLAITGGFLKPVFIGSASAPDLSNAFWQSTQSWTVINNTGAGTASGALAVDNSAWAAHGSFSTLVDGNDLVLTWNAIPEPASLSLLALGGLMMLRRGRMA